MRPSEAAVGVERCGLDELRARALRLEQAGGPSAAARRDIGSCHLGFCTFGKLTLGKIHLGSCRFGKLTVLLGAEQ